MTILDPSPGTWGDLLGRRYLGTSVVLAGGVALCAINVYLTTSLLPTAVNEIGGEHYYSLASSVYLIASVIAALTVGAVLLRLGPRASYLLGLGIFAAGVLACFLAPTMEVFLLARVVQGLGGGLLAGLGYAVINAVLPRELWTRASALVSMMWGVGTLVGPIVGGLFAQLGQWRAAYLVLLIVTLCVAVLVPFSLPRGTGERAGVVRVPYLALVILTASTALISAASVVEAPLSKIAAVILAFILLAVFLLADRRAVDGVFPRATFGAGALKWIYVTIAVLSAASTVEIFIPLFGQRLGGLSPLLAGFLGAVLAVGWTLGEIWSAEKHRPGTVRRIVIAGPLLVAGGLAAVAAFQNLAVSLPVLLLWALGLLLAGAGIGIAWPHLAAAAMGAVADPVEGAKASAAISTVQLIANAFGAAIAGLLVSFGSSTLASANLLYAGFAALAALVCCAAVRAIPRIRSRA